MKSFFSSRVWAFRHAFRGWFYVLRTQRNAWIHSLAAIAVFAIGLWVELSMQDWAIIVLTVALVFIAEFINTAIEAVVDLASPDKHPLAKIGKDVGAAAVLVAAMTAVLVGLLILGPPLLGKVTNRVEITRTEQTAFKGMELYVWQGQDGEWHYAILAGTNRNKTFDEVQAASMDMHDIKDVIRQLAIGESLFWMQAVSDSQSGEVIVLPLPPHEIVDELREFAHEYQVDLIVP